MSQQTEKEYLSPQHRSFIKEYFQNGFNATEAYMKVYPSTSTYRSAQVSASRLLKKAIIAQSIYNKLQAEEVTDDFVISRLKEIALMDDPIAVGAAVRALMTLARILGMLTPKKHTFSDEFPVIFLSPFSQEEIDRMQKVREEGVRIIE